MCEVSFAGLLFSYLAQLFSVGTASFIAVSSAAHAGSRVVYRSVVVPVTAGTRRTLAHPWRACDRGLN